MEDMLYIILNNLPLNAFQVLGIGVRGVLQGGHSNTVLKMNLGVFYAECKIKNCEKF